MHFQSPLGAGSYRHAYPGILPCRLAIAAPDYPGPSARQSRSCATMPVWRTMEDWLSGCWTSLLLDILGEEAGLAEKKMFGGLAVLLGGNMAVGVYGDGLLVRTDPGQQDMLLAEPGTRPFDMTGRR